MVWISAVILLWITIECVMYSKYAVKIAIPFPIAWNMQQVGENFFVVGQADKYDKCGTEMYFYYDGLKKVPVRITGTSPFHSTNFRRYFKESLIFICGDLNEEMSELTGVDVIEAKKWYIIAPINRNEFAFKRRIAPIWYIDVFDVEEGAYEVIDENIRAIIWWEEEWLRNIWDGKYIFITSDYLDNELQWYRINSGVETEIVLTGNTPEQYYVENVEAKERKDTLDNKENRFIVKGTWSEEETVFYIEHWYRINYYNWTISDFEY